MRIRFSAILLVLTGVTACKLVETQSGTLDAFEDEESRWAAGRCSEALKDALNDRKRAQGMSDWCVEIMEPNPYRWYRDSSDSTKVNGHLQATVTNGRDTRYLELDVSARMGEDCLPIELPPFTSEVLYYRGLSEDQLKIEDALRITAGLASGPYVPSWRWSNLKALLSDDVTDAELAAKMDQDIAYMGQSGLWRFGHYHMGIFDCYVPDRRTMVARSFRGLELPSDIQDLLDNLDDLETIQEIGRVVKYFDPAISTSASLGVARGFSGNYRGYVLIVADVDDRNCPGDDHCIRLDSEYPFELEFQFFGYIAPHEIMGLSLGLVQVRRAGQGKVLVIYEESDTEVVLGLAAEDGSCADGEEHDLSGIDERLAEGLKNLKLVCKLP